LARSLARSRRRGAVALELRLRQLALDERLLADRRELSPIAVAVRDGAAADFPIQHANSTLAKALLAFK
jgi:hypothetical protein